MIEIRIKDQTPELMQKVEAATGRFVRKAAAYIDGELKSSMAEPKSGRRYKRGKDQVHIASAPGESPAIDTSNLVNSITQIFPSTLEAKVGTPVEYAVWLEDPDGLNRPLWEQTAKDSLPTLEKLLQSELRKAH